MEEHVLFRFLECLNNSLIVNANVNTYGGLIFLNLNSLHPYQLLGSDLLINSSMYLEEVRIWFNLEKNAIRFLSANFECKDLQVHFWKAPWHIQNNLE